MAFNEKAWHVGFKWTIGDEDNPTGAICLDDSSDALHICEIRDATTDWAVSTTSHPTLYIHSASDPATDYISMYHDGTSGLITLDGTTILTLTATTLDIAVATTIAGDLDITTDDIAVSQGYHVYFDGLGVASEHIMSDTENYLEINATTGITLTIGNTDEVAVDATAVTLATNNLVLTAGDITLAVGKYLYLDGSTGNYLRTSTDDNVILNGGTTVNLGIAGTTEAVMTSGSLTLATNNLTLTAGNLSVVQGSYIYLDGQNGDEYIVSQTTGTIYFWCSGTGYEAINFIVGANGGINLGGSGAGGYLGLYCTDTDASRKGQLWYDNSENVLKFYNGSAVATVVDTKAVVHFENHVRVLTDKLLSFRDNQLYIQSDADSSLKIGSNGIISFYIDGTTYSAVNFVLGAGGGINLGGSGVGGYLGLWVTDTNGAREGQVWYDNSENLIKYYNGSAVRTLVDEESVNHFTNSKYFDTDTKLYFRDLGQYIYSWGDGELSFVCDGTTYHAFNFVGAGSGAGLNLSECFLGLWKTGTVGSREGQVWYDTASNKIHFWDGDSEEEVTSTSA